MIISFFRIAAAFVSMYSFLCFIRIILTWIPGMSYSRFTEFLAGICDPYMNLFRRFRWLRIGSFDFSPALALCVLGAVSSLLNALANGGTVSVGMILAVAVQVVFSIISSLITFIIIVFVIRLIVILVNRNAYNQSSFMLNQIDSSISSLVYRIARTFSFGKTLTYKVALIIAIISLVACQAVLNILLNILINILSSLPI